MFLAACPSADAIERFLNASLDLPLSYGPVGIVREKSVEGRSDVAPRANPTSARREMASITACRTGEAGCCNRVANAQTDNIYKLSSLATIRYSGQW